MGASGQTKCTNAAVSSQRPFCCHSRLILSQGGSIASLMHSACHGTLNHPFISGHQAESRTQVMALEENARDFNLTYYAMDDKRQGIVHIIGPEQVGVGNS